MEAKSLIKRMFIVKMFIILILIVFMLVLYPVSNVYSQEKNKKLKILKLAIGYIPHIQFAPLYVGIEKGFYKQQGIDLKIQYGFGIDIFSLLLSKKIDIGLSDSDQLIIAGDKGMKLKAIFQYYQKYPVSIIARKDVITKITDLKGKKIGVPAYYGTSYIGLLLFLKKYNLLNKVIIQKIGYNQIPALLSKKVEAVVCFSNNEPIQLKLRGVELVKWDVADFSDIVGASFISADDIINEKKELIKGFIKATAKAMSFVSRYQNDAFEISKNYIGNFNQSSEIFFKQVLKETLKLFKSPGGYGYINIEKYQKSIEILYYLNLIKNRYDASKIVINNIY